VPWGSAGRSLRRGPRSAPGCPALTQPRPLARQRCQPHMMLAMWYVAQGAIVFAVIASNIHWHWTPNPYLAAGVGWLTAYFTTAALLGWRLPETPPK
jgi:hypothetical protein